VNNKNKDMILDKSNMFFLLAVCCFPVFSLKGQTTGAAFDTHEFSAGVGGGLSTLQYTGSRSGAGMNLHLGYRYFFHARWGVGSGMEAAWYRASLTPENPFARSSETVAMGTAMSNAADNRMTYTATLTGYSERQQALLLQIPLMAHFRHPMGERLHYWAAAGGKLGIPLSSGYSADAYKLSTQGYFAAENVVYDNLPQHGFVKDRAQPSVSGGDFKPKAGVMLSVETGVQWKLNGGYSFYAGAYFDYGLTDVSPRAGDEPVRYSGDASPAVGSLAASPAIAGNIRNIAAGLKIGITLGKSAVRTGSVPPPPNRDNNGARTVHTRRTEASRVLPDIARPEATTRQESQKGATLNGAILPYPIRFEFNEATFTPESVLSLQQTVRWLKDHPYANIEISGHTDNTGTDETNRRLSDLRTQSVYDYLTQNGIAPDRLTRVGCGANRPIASNDTEEGRAQNRRVEIRITVNN
jgi:outer membrane protein OmpA-like peptidoglycan-associated protein